MARTVKEQEFNEKRNDILNAAQRLVYTKGYERMTIQDILVDLQISSGAFYHYFDSKPAVLESLAERMQDEMEQRVLPIVRDPDLLADEKLQRFFGVMLREDLTKEQRILMIQLLKAWFADDNALIRQKVDEGRVARLAPLLTEIVHQGIAEGSFTPALPELIGEIILSLIEGLQYSLARLYSRFKSEGDERQFIAGNVTAYDGYMEAIERLLGVSSNLLSRLDPEKVKESLAIETTTRN